MHGPHSIIPSKTLVAGKSAFGKLSFGHVSNFDVDRKPIGSLTSSITVSRELACRYETMVDQKIRRVLTVQQCARTSAIVSHGSCSGLKLYETHMVTSRNAFTSAS